MNRISLKRAGDLLVIGEQNIFKNIVKLMDIAIEANSISIKMLKEDIELAEIEELTNKLHQLKNSSSNETFKMNEKITSGAISPNILDQLLGSVHLADDIVDLYYHIGEELNRMSRAYSEGYGINHVRWDVVYVNILSLAEKAFSTLKKSLSSAKIEDILNFRNEIKNLEEKGDSIKDTGFDRLYRVASKMHYLEFYHYTELLHKCDDILDSCEDLSDLIVSVVTSIVR